MQIIETITNAGTTFASFVYRSKSDNSVARYTVILGGKYSNLLEKSKLELELNLSENKYTGIDLDAANAVLDSINKSIIAHSNGTQNSDYTKKNQYEPLGNGMNINTKDNSIQVFGLLQSKVVIEPGVRKEVKSSPMTIAKNKVRKALPISKFREFAFDIGNIKTVKVNNDTLEIIDSYEFEPTTESVTA